MVGRSDLIDDLERIVALCAEREGLPAECIRRLSVSVCTLIQRNWGSGSHYIRAEDRAERDQAILSGLSSGAPIAAVAASVGVHERTVRRVRDRHKRASFGPADWAL
jgi:hypothetical protein